MPTLVLAEARLARKYNLLSIELNNWSARVSRVSADSLRHVGNREALCGSEILGRAYGSVRRRKLNMEPGNSGAESRRS
jgi:hypothetical protein